MSKYIPVTLAGVFASGAAFAEEIGTVTLPDTGIDMAAYANSAISYLGGVIAVVVGGCVAFMLIRKGLRALGWIH